MKEELKKEFYGTTLPPRLEKFEALLKNRDEGKGFFLGEKVRYSNAQIKHSKGLGLLRTLTSIERFHSRGQQNKRN